jgi:hypothetical protein
LVETIIVTAVELINNETSRIIIDLTGILGNPTFVFFFRDGLVFRLRVVMPAIQPPYIKTVISY